MATPPCQLTSVVLLNRVVYLNQGVGPDDIQKLGFGDERYKNILQHTRKIKGLLDHFVVNILAFAENRDRIDAKLSVLRFASQDDVDTGLKTFGEALWLGRLPKPGIYFTNPLTRFLRRRLKLIGRRDHDFRRVELGLIRYSKTAEVEVTAAKLAAKRSKLVIELPEHSLEECFLLYAPNCDYFNLPAEVNTFELLMKWLGSRDKPTFDLKEKNLRRDLNEDLPKR